MKTQYVERVAFALGAKLTKIEAAHVAKEWSWGTPAADAATTILEMRSKRNLKLRCECDLQDNSKNSDHHKLCPCYLHDGMGFEKRVSKMEASLDV